MAKSNPDSATQFSGEAERPLPPAPTADPKDEHAPLTTAERAELGQLMHSFGADPMAPRVPGAPADMPKTPENYERLKELHARAKYQADNWHEDGKTVASEMFAGFDLVIQILRTVVATVPAAAAANQTMALLNDSHTRMKAAMTPPPPVPDLPPSPDDQAAEEKAAADKAEADRKAANEKANLPA